MKALLIALIIAISFIAGGVVANEVNHAIAAGYSTQTVIVTGSFIALVAVMTCFGLFLGGMELIGSLYRSWAVWHRDRAEELRVAEHRGFYAYLATKRELRHVDKAKEFEAKAKEFS